MIALRSRCGTRHAARWIAGALVVCALPACAARRPAPLSARFVHPAGDQQPLLELTVPATAGGAAAAPEAAPRPAAAPTEPDDAGSPPAAPRRAADLDDLDGGLAAARAALSADPSVAHAIAVADRYRAWAVYDRADRVIEDALVRHPRDARLHELRARVWRDWDLPGVALAHAHRAVYYAPESADALNTLATVLGAVGAYADAAGVLERAAALDPDAAHITSNRCYVAVQLGDREAASGICAEAVRRAPDSPHARNNLALAQVAAGRDALASASFMAAGGAARGAFNLGIARMARGEFALAAEAFADAAAAAPGFGEAVARAAQARARAALAGRTVR